MTELRFEFGKNWRSFVDTVVDKRSIDDAVSSLQRMLNVEDLSGKTFLDVGCGSGLFSLAACILRADRVVSFDYDPISVEASMSLREKANIPTDKWQLLQGSILDKTFLDALDPADFVYSWGVLHHTGAMWQAIDNTVSKVKPGGVFAISIYNKVERRFAGSAMWWQVKRVYNQSPKLVKNTMEVAYLSIAMLYQHLSLRNPLKIIQQRGHGDSGRGMSFRHDLRDWMGGFPFEYATAGEVFNFLYSRYDLKLEYLRTTHTATGCNEYTFRRPDQTSCSPES